MASNYYSYPYENTSYTPNQNFSSDQYSSVPTAQHTSLSQQVYYRQNGQPAPHPPQPTRPQASDNTRPTPTQYNGLHFPAPNSSRQVTAPGSNYEAARPIAGARELNTPDNSGNYGGNGPSRSVSKVSKPSLNHGSSGSSGLYDRAETALAASSGWNMNSEVIGASDRNSNANYSPYAYPKSDEISQKTYHNSQRSTSSKPTSGYSSSIQPTHLQAAEYNSSGLQSVAKTSIQNQATTAYNQSSQITPSSYRRTYETSQAGSLPSMYSQSSEYGKPAYQDDTDQVGSYNQNIYTLPQPSATRSHEAGSSYFTTSHSVDASTCADTSLQNPTGKHVNYDRGAQNSGRTTSSREDADTMTYETGAPIANSQYYQNYNSVVTTQTPTSSNVPTSSSSASKNPSNIEQPIVQTKARKTAASNPKSKKSSAPTTQKPLTVKTPKPRAPRKPKETAANVPAQTPAETPRQHIFYPAAGSQATLVSNNNAQTATGQAEYPESSIVTQQVSAPDRTSSAAPPSATPELASMEQHMREMVEKMREYQSRDPMAFQQVWDNVKKSGPGATKPVIPNTTASKATPGVDSPRQVGLAPVKPASANSPVVRHSTPATVPPEGGRNTPVPGSAASQAQRTVWPAVQKISLSQTTARFLNGLGQHCPESLVIGLLDYGPTFPELCMKLEAKGYKFERNKLAVELLKTPGTLDATKSREQSSAAPAISAAAPMPSSNSNVLGGPRSNGIADVPPRNLTPLSFKSFNPRDIKESIPSFPPPDHEVPSQNFVAPSLIYREVYPQRISIERPNKSFTEPSITQNTNSQSSQNKSKENATIDAAVATTVITDPQPKVTQPPRTASVIQQVQTPPLPSISLHYEMVIEYNSEPLPPLPNVYSSPTSQIQTSTATEDFSALKILQSKLERQVSLSKELASPSKSSSQRDDALRVAKPPVSPPQPLPSTRKDTLPNAPKFDRKKAFRRNNYDSGTIVHAVLLATGRHPHYEGLNSQLSILKRLHPEAFDNNTDLAAIPWDIYDPPPAPLPEDEKDIKVSLDDEEEIRGRRREPAPLPTAVIRSDINPSLSFTDGKVRGKRGRPRGSRGMPRGGVKSAVTAAKSREHINNHSAEDSSTAANAHRYGIPTSTRVNINTLNASGNSNGGSGRKRKHGNSPPSRRPGDEAPIESKIPQMIPVFKCKWEKCHSELQNLETLRRHLIKKHRAENHMGVLPCCWADCGSLIPVEMKDQNGRKFIEQRRKRLNFGTGSAWDRHVLDGHLRSVREELGEGISVETARSISRASSAHSVENRIRSMSRDRNGRSLTPVITPAPFGYKFTPPPGFSAGNQYRLAHEIDGEFLDEKKMYENELARVARIGAGMEGFSTPLIPGLEYDTGEGYSLKVRKLIGEDLSVLPPNYPVKKKDESGLEKGKGRAQG